MNEFGHQPTFHDDRNPLTNPDARKDRRYGDAEVAETDAETGKKAQADYDRIFPPGSRKRRDDERRRGVTG